MADNNNRIVFISVPESLRGQIESLNHHHHDDQDDDTNDEGTGFSIDPSIPIPVELRPGENELNLEELSWEMILSGMIRVVMESMSSLEDGSNEDADYYRRFVLAVKPDIFEEFNEAAILKARNGDYDLALEILDALGGLFPGSAIVLLNRALVQEERADAFERLGKDREAENAVETAWASYNELLEKEPPFANGFFNAAFFAMKHRDFALARDHLSRYLAITENAGEGEAEKREHAAETLKNIQESGLDDDNFHEAYELIKAGRENEGLIEIRSYLEKHPAVWNGWFLLGWALRRLERWEDGADAFRKAIELGGNASDTRNELAICLMELDDLKGARRELETALGEEPENTKIISNLGVLAMRNGDDDEAAAFFRTALELDPEDPVAKSGLEALES
jgi:Flp pilus assembly protein TadD